MVRSGERSEQDAARAEAALLVVRHKDKQITAEADLEHWLADDPVRANAYLECERVWNDLGQIAPDWGGPNTLPTSKVTALTRRQVGLAAMAACVSSFAALGGIWMWNAPDYVTNKGEQRVIKLPDGTRVIMNTDTRLKLKFSDGRRLIKLERGEALFDVSHDAARPFVVDTGRETVRALGTRFVVRTEARNSEVILLSGSVEVSVSSDNHGKVYRLEPGDRIRRLDTDAVSLDQPKIDVVTAWRRGELVLDNTALPQAVAEMNRYSPKPIVIHSERLHSEYLSGVFRVGDAHAFAQTVATIYKLRMRETDSQIRIE